MLLPLMPEYLIQICMILYLLNICWSSNPSAGLASNYLIYKYLAGGSWRVIITVVCNQQSMPGEIWNINLPRQEQFLLFLTFTAGNGKAWKWIIIMGGALQYNQCYS